MYETPVEYAQRRAKETKRPYIITGMGHVLVDTPANRAGLDYMGGLHARIVARVKLPKV